MKSFFKKNKVAEQNNIIEVDSSEEVAQMNQGIARARSNRMKITVLAAAAIALVTIVVTIFLMTRNKTYNAIRVLHTNKVTMDANAEYMEFCDNLLKYTPSGVSYINAGGDVVWTAGVDFKVPIGAANGEYAVVADKGGNTVAVFNTQGEVGKFSMPYAICDIDITSKGAFTAILQSDETNYITMYSSQGEKIYELQTSIDKSGYPMDIAISDDGEKLVSSYFRLDGINIKNNLTCYNFGDVGKNENADRMVGGFTFDQIMIPKVKFLTNDLFAAFSDKEIQLFDMKEKPSKRCVISYGDKEITSIFYSNSYVGTIRRGVGESTDGYVMTAYDLDGNKIFEYNFKFDFDRIYANEDEIIVTGGNQCLIVTSKGRTKFKYSFDAMIKTAIPTSSSNEYIFTFENKAETIELTRED